LAACAAPAPEGGWLRLDDSAIGSTAARLADLRPGETLVITYGGGTRAIGAAVRRDAPPPGLPGPGPGAIPAQPRSTSGTGFVIARDGLVATNAHVVAGCTRITLADGTPLALLRADAGRDLAVLRAERSFPVALPLRAGQPAELGEAVLVLGFPFGQTLGTGLTVTNGIVTGMTGLGGDPRRFQTNAAIQPGSSGGPVLDEQGRVIGIAASRLDDLAILGRTGALPQGVNFAVRAEELAALLAEARLAAAPDFSRGPATRSIAAAAAPAVVQIRCEN
ncbi:MAG: serine protease, partial [Acetobacteraceae bacterium]|nr:serine protease [Acetobacteraceae bacterium]